MNTTGGLCECGCGQLAPIAKNSWKKKGWVKGQPKRFVAGHQNRKGALCSAWRGGRVKMHRGYIGVFLPKHKRAMPNGYVREHILIAERALGKPLPLNAVIH